MYLFLSECILLTFDREEERPYTIHILIQIVFQIDSTKLCSKRNSTFAGETFTSQGSLMTVYFHSDSSRAKSGFKAVYTQLPYSKCQDYELIWILPWLLYLDPDKVPAPRKKNNNKITSTTTSCGGPPLAFI